MINDLSMVGNAGSWTGLQTIIMIGSERINKATGETENETRIYISSLGPDVKTIGSAIRKHWGIKNKVHWVPKVAFGEDNSRKRQGMPPKIIQL